MPKSFFNPADYALVADRITEFYDRYPTGRIITNLVSREQETVFRAEVYRRSEDTQPASTGWASEREGDGEINLYACLENSETSAIGRALANLGFTASRKRPSYEEMQKAERMRLRFQQSPAPATSQRVAETTTPPPASQKNRESTEPLSPVQKITNKTRDITSLISEAVENGVPAIVLERTRQRLNTGLASLEELTTMERQLRHWVLNGYPAPQDKDADSQTQTPPVNTSHQ